MHDIPFHLRQLKFWNINPGLKQIIMDNLTKITKY